MTTTDTPTTGAAVRQAGALRTILAITEDQDTADNMVARIRRVAEAALRAGAAVKAVALAFVLAVLGANSAHAADALTALRDVERAAIEPNATPIGFGLALGRARPAVAADTNRDPALGRALGAYESAHAEMTNAQRPFPTSGHVLNADCPGAVNFAQQMAPLVADVDRTTVTMAGARAAAEAKAKNHLVAAGLYIRCAQDWQRVAERNAQRADVKAAAPIAPAGPTCRTRPDGVLECGNR